jgi:hypothetical protein
MRVLHLPTQTLETIAGDLVAGAEEWVLEGLLRCEAFLGVVFQEPREQAIAFCAEADVGGGGRGGGVRIDGAVVPLF